MTILLAGCLSFIGPSPIAKARTVQSVCDSALSALGVDGFYHSTAFRKSALRGRPSLTKHRVVTVGESFSDLTPSSVFEENYSFHNDKRYSKPLARQSAQTVRFDISLTENEIHRIEVVMTKDFAIHRGMSDEDYASYLIGLLPLTTIKATRLIELRPDRFDIKEDRRFSMATGVAFRKNAFSMHIHTGEPAYEVEKKVLLHEHAHNVGAFLFGDSGSGGYPKFWQALIKLDHEQYVSDYAKTNLAEDFAETFRVYLETEGGKLDPDLRKMFSHRFAAIDEIFAQENGGLLKGGLWDQMRKFRNTKVIGVIGGSYAAMLGLIQLLFHAWR